jgi:glycosyltransferase involved in cell wall biosynthesis
MIDPRHPNYQSTPISPDRPVYGYRQRVVPGVQHRAPVVSIVTPYYNTGSVARETMLSVLGQSLQDFEWIIVNDGSSNSGALAVLDEFRMLAECDSRVRVIDHRVNHGLPAARNTGIRAARGEYVFFLDADDLIEPTCIEKCALFLACNPSFGFAKGYNVGFGAQEYLWTNGFHEHTRFLHENRVTATAMVRTSVLHDVGMFDESVRGGFEDWEFWLRCAGRAHWGHMIPEYLDWYRRRPNQAQSWDSFNSQCAKERLLAKVRSMYPHLFEGGFPAPRQDWHMPMHPVSEQPPLENPLQKDRQRLLMILPWLRMGGADKFNLDVLRETTKRGWEVTIACTLDGQHWLPEFSKHTPDIFPLRHLGIVPDFPRLLTYLIRSRRPDVVMLSNSEIGYQLLPYLRSRCPEPTYVDYNHMEEPHWRDGGHPRGGVGAQSQLDLNIVSSEHLKRWQASRGAKAERIRVCYTNCDTELWKQNPAARETIRAAYEIGEDTPVLLYAVRLCAQKQPLVFGETMRLLRDAGRRFVALVAGDGEDRGMLESYLGRHDLREHVRMLGAVKTDDMPSLMSASDIFFLPSQWEGIALSVYEAMSIGLCVVGADVGGQRELVTPETGILIDPAVPVDEQSRLYAEILSGLLNDPARCAELGAAARRRIHDHFPLKAMGERMLEIFAEATELKKQEPRTVLPEALSHEWAVQVIEQVRANELCDYLWPLKERWVAHEQQMQAAAQASNNARRCAEEALCSLEATRSFRWLARVKRTAPYRLYAQRRFGPDWAEQMRQEDPQLRLARVQASRAYKAVELAKQTPIYPGYMVVKSFARRLGISSSKR